MRQAGIVLSETWDISETFVGAPDGDAEREHVVTGGQPGSGMSGEELRLVDNLRRGDEHAFASLVDRYHSSLIRLALAHVPDRSIAEEVVQETWLAIIEGIQEFEGRSSLKTWIFRILTNKAKTRGVRESRHISVSPLGASEDEPDEPAVDPSRFRATGHWVDYWDSYLQPWDEETPEKCFLTKEGAAYLEQAIAKLPPRLREILVLRDVEGVSSKDVCAMLVVSEANQRVLLHRARSKVRQALEDYVKGGMNPA
jgi:RNA polymerase sigma-70 factor (ECF subfamily)